MNKQLSLYIKVLLLLLTAVYGCSSIGDYKLISIGETKYISGWHQYVNPRPPENNIEKAVVNVANTMKDSEYNNLDILFITHDFTHTYDIRVVDVVTKDTSKAEYPIRTVIRYRIYNDMISAMSDPSNEFYVNADFERAILRAVSTVYGACRVITYNDGTKIVAIKAESRNRCTATVKVFDTDVTNFVPLAQKDVAFCFQR